MRIKKFHLRSGLQFQYIQMLMQKNVLNYGINLTALHLLPVIIFLQLKNMNISNILGLNLQ